MAYVVHQSMPFLSKDEIECRTEKLLAEFQTLEEAPIGFPIPVERIAEGLLNLRMDWDAIDETDVLARLDPSTRTVTMNTARIDFFDEYPGAQNFTVAHEIGHWKLHIYATNAVQLAMFTTKVQPFLCRSDARNRYEIQANLFAASLLMPRALIVQDYR